MAKKKRPGHYCKICGERKSNESFSGKGHAVHICKKCQSLPAEVQTDMRRVRDVEEVEEYDDDYGYGFTDIDRLPVFVETMKFKELHNEFKTLLREYIHREVSAYWELHKKNPPEHILIEIRKRMLCALEEEYSIALKNDALFRQFFGDNAASVLNKLQKKAEENG